MRVSDKKFSVPMKVNEKQEFCCKRKTNNSSATNPQRIPLLQQQTNLRKSGAQKPSTETDFVTG